MTRRARTSGSQVPELLEGIQRWEHRAAQTFTGMATPITDALARGESVALTRQQCYLGTYRVDPALAQALFGWADVEHRRDTYVLTPAGILSESTAGG